MEPRAEEALERLASVGILPPPLPNLAPGTYMDRCGEVITFAQWVVLFEDFWYRSVKLDRIADGIEVSTVWLGLDHGWGLGVRLLFETAVIVDLDEPRPGLFGALEREFPEIVRWSTEEQAIAGHDRIVEELRSNLG